MTTNYQLLKDVHEVVERIESKLDARIVLVEGRVDKLEGFQANLTGKITVLGAVMMLVVNFLWDFGRSLVKRII